MSNALISVLTLPDGTSYDIKDAWARTAIGELQSYTDYLGVTSTELTDGATTNPITINNESVTARKGNITNYGSKEFIFNGTAWQEFGDMSGLKALAFKDSASAEYTPAGTIENTPATATVNSITAVGTLPKVEPTTDTVYSITAVGTLPKVEPTTGTVNSITAVGTLPSFSYNSSNETLTFSAGTLPTKGADVTVVTDVGYTAGTLPTKGAGQTVVTDVGYTAGTLPTKGSDVSVLTGVTSAFTGTKATITVS